jgi:hypothetical protein
MRISRKWSLFGRHYLFLLQSVKTPNTPTKGMSARVPHSIAFTVFLDYDNIEDESLDDELVALQEVHRLGDFHVFQTSEHGRHAVCIDEIAPRDAYAIVISSRCDWMFKRGIRINEYRTWILRNWEKGERERPKFLRTIESPYNGERLQSQGHAMFLRAFCGANVRLVNADGNEEIEIQDYNTSSKVTTKDLLRERKKHGL